MNNNVIVVREAYDWITEQQITSTQYEELVNYIEKKYPTETIIEQKYRKLRFINYVGVIQCSNIRYEILPKINLSQGDERKSLLSMLSMTNFLPISFYEKVKNGNEFSEDLLSAFLAAFLEKLLTELKKGVYKSYVVNSENLNVLKGKLELSQHIRRNAFHRTRAYCSFDEHSENNLLNQLFKAALMIVRNNIVLTSQKLNLERCLGYLDYVNLIKFDPNMLEKVTLNRQNSRFDEAVLFAKLIIEHASIYSSGKQSSSFSFLFPMNLLFEKYIEVALKQAIDSEKVISQHAEKRLLLNKRTGYKNILLKPDFVIDGEAIVDTKWKSSVYEGRITYSQSDIYQMYAYVTAYKDVKRCILLYPKQEDEVTLPIWEVIDTDKTIQMQMIRIDDFQATVEDLKNLLNCP